MHPEALREALGRRPLPSRDDRLLLALSRNRPSARDVAIVSELLADHVDWDYVLTAAIRHATAPLVARALAQVMPAEVVEQRVPAYVRSELADLLERSRHRSTRLQRTLSAVATALAEAGVQVIALKELAMAGSVYADGAVRPPGDIDLLIRRSAYTPAVAALGRLGFVSLPTYDLRYTLRYAYGHHCRRAEDDVWIDLQWNLAEREWDLFGEGTYRYDIEGMWSRAEPLDRERRLLRPSTEDLLFHLCVHLEGHGYAELVLLTDIDALLTSGVVVDWSLLLEIARGHDAGGSVYYALLLANRLFGTPVDAAALDRFRSLYFQAPLHALLFGNLGALHLSLDDIARVGAVGEGVMRGFEGTVRRQARAAMAAYAELDQIARAGALAGPMAIEGEPPPMMYPDAHGNAFGAITFLTAPEGVGAVRRALDEKDYETGSIRSGVDRERGFTLGSSDPALGGEPTRLRVEVELDRRPPAMTARPARSKSALAIQLLRQRLRRRPGRTEAVVRLRVRGRTLEEQLVDLVQAAWSRPAGRLFALVPAIDVLARSDRPLDARLVADAAGPTALPGLAVLASLSADAALGAATAAAASDEAGTRLFEWARYGPDQHVQRPQLRRPFLLTLALLATPGLRHRLRLLGRARAAGGRAPALASLRDLGSVAPTILRRFNGPATDDPRALAYWIESDVNMARRTDRES